MAVTELPVNSHIRDETFKGWSYRHRPAVVDPCQEPHPFPFYLSFLIGSQITHQIQEHQGIFTPGGDSNRERHFCVMLSETRLHSPYVQPAESGGELDLG